MPNTQATWDDVILDDQLKRAIKRDYVSFFRNEELYKGLQVPWKRGLILMGVSEAPHPYRFYC